MQYCSSTSMRFSWSFAASFSLIQQFGAVFMSCQQWRLHQNHFNYFLSLSGNILLLRIAKPPTDADADSVHNTSKSLQIRPVCDSCDFDRHVHSLFSTFLFFRPEIPIKNKINMNSDQFLVPRFRKNECTHGWDGFFPVNLYRAQFVELAHSPSHHFLNTWLLFEDRFLRQNYSIFACIYVCSSQVCARLLVSAFSYIQNKERDTKGRNKNEKWSLHSPKTAEYKKVKNAMALESVQSKTILNTRACSTWRDEKRLGSTTTTKIKTNSFMGIRNRAFDLYAIGIPYGNFVNEWISIVAAADLKSRRRWEKRWRKK